MTDGSAPSILGKTMQPGVFEEEPWYKDPRLLHVAAGVALAALGLVVAASYPRGMGHDLGIVLVGAGGGVAISGVTTVHMLVHSFKALLGVLVSLQDTVRADVAPRFTRAFTLGSELVCYLRVSTDIRDQQHAQILEAAAGGWGRRPRSCGSPRSGSWQARRAGQRDRARGL